MDKQVNTGCVLSLAGRLTIWGAADLRFELLDKLNQDISLVLNLAPADEIDIAGFQVLAAAARYAEIRKLSITINQPVPVYFTRWLESAGFSLTDLTAGAPNV